MDSFYRSPFNQTATITNQGRSNLLKEWHQLKGEPTSAVFRFPKSTLENNYSEQKNKTMKKYRSKGKMGERTVELGRIGQQMQRNMRQTFMNQARTTFSPSKTSRSAYFSNNTNAKQIKDDALRTMQIESNKKTMHLLQKAIMEQDYFFYFQENLLNLNTGKLPILAKHQPQRKRRPLKKTDQKSSKHIRNFSERPQQNKKTPSSAQLPISKKQKPEICGWDTIELHDL